MKSQMTLIITFGFSIALKAQSDTSFKSTGNPIITHKYTADAAAIVHKDKLYLYAGQDVAAPKENRYVMQAALAFCYVNDVLLAKER